MDSISESITKAGFVPVKYGNTKDAVELSTTFERDDNNKFVSDITRALLELDSSGTKISAINLSKKSKYPLKEIELNLYEITNIMDALCID